MSVLVVDASVLATVLADGGRDGDLARARLRGNQLTAPELVDLDVVSVLRRQVAAKAVDASRADLALNDLLAMPLQRASHRPLLDRCREPTSSAGPGGHAHVRTPPCGSKRRRAALCRDRHDKRRSLLNRRGANSGQQRVERPGQGVPANGRLDE